MFIGHGAPAVFGVLATLVSVLFFLVCLAVIVALLFILVRFLLVATKAAQLYVAQHERAAAAPVVEPTVTPTPPVTKPTATRAQTATTTTRKPRTPNKAE